jgi:hypothetical protein
MARTRTPEQHREDSQYAAHVMWSGVADRAARLANMHQNSPSGYTWHARRLLGQDVDLEALTPTQWKQVEAARAAWFKASSRKGVKARKLDKAQRLRDEIAAIEAEYNDSDGEAGDA